MVNDVHAAEIYLIDANALMVAARQFYAFDLIPAFWYKLDASFQAGRIVLLDLVRDEIDKGQDQLKEWIRLRQQKIQICSHVQEDIVPQYQRIVQLVYESGFYKEHAINGWFNGTVADPWLIAAAAAKSYVLVSFEQSAGSLSTKQKSGKIKIPDVAAQFQVEQINLYEMMRRLGIRI